MKYYVGTSTTLEMCFCVVDVVVLGGLEGGLNFATGHGAYIINNNINRPNNNNNNTVNVPSTLNHYRQLLMPSTPYLFVTVVQTNETLYTYAYRVPSPQQSQIHKHKHYTNTSTLIDSLI